MKKLFGLVFGPETRLLEPSEKATNSAAAVSQLTENVTSSAAAVIHLTTRPPKKHKGPARQRPRTHAKHINLA